MDVNTALQRRKSVRYYLRENVEPRKLDKIITIGNNSKGLDPEVGLSFRLIEDGHKFYKAMKGHGGYLGNVINAPHYIVALTEKSGRYLENLGYKMERLMLGAQELGLGTCWIELFFNKERINKILNIEESNIGVIAFTPVGFERIPLSHRIIKDSENAKSKRKSVSEILYFDTWENNRSPKNDFEYNIYKVIDYARLAPSWANIQPWRFIVTENNVMLFSKIDQATKDKVNYYRIDCGIIMLYFELLANQIGIAGRWDLNRFDNIKKYKTPDKYEYVGEFIIK